MKQSFIQIFCHFFSFFFRSATNFTTKFNFGARNSLQHKNKLCHVFTISFLENPTLVVNLYKQKMGKLRLRGATKVFVLISSQLLRFRSSTTFYLDKGTNFCANTYVPCKCKLYPYKMWTDKNLSGAMLTGFKRQCKRPIFVINLLSSLRIPYRPN